MEQLFQQAVHEKKTLAINIVSKTLGGTAVHTGLIGTTLVQTTLAGTVVPATFVGT